MWLRSGSSFAVHHPCPKHNHFFWLNKLDEYHCKSQFAFRYIFQFSFCFLWNCHIYADTDDRCDSRL